MIGRAGREAPLGSREAPLGLFDSGVGGLTVVRELLWRLPAESILYVADTAHVPYGGRPADDIRRYAVGLTRWLAGQGCKLILMACNTSSAIALEDARAAVDVPVLGVLEYGAQAAAAVLNGGRIGVLATEGTVRSEAYPTAVRRVRDDAPVVQAACPSFVPLIEAGRLSTPDAYQAVCDALAPLPLGELDALVLGCTHYPFLAPLIRMRAAEPTHLVDPAVATARAVAALLRERDRLASGPPRHRLCATGSTDSCERVNRRCFSGRLPACEAIGEVVA